MFTPFKHNDFCRFVHPPDPCSSCGATRHSSNNNNLHNFILLSLLHPVYTHRGIYAISNIVQF